MTSPRETVLCQYHYDPLDRLISHALQDIPERQRFYCNSRLATEIQGAMRYAIVQHGDHLLAQQRSEGDVPDATLLATDQQRSVLQALRADYPRQPIAYSPYGHHSIESGLLSLLGFNGERADPVTGCYFLGNGYRGFKPVLMRFNSPDNLSPFGKGGLNPYTYCFGDPVNRTDPTGHFSQAIVDKLLAWASRAKDQISTRFARSLAPSNTSATPLINSGPPNNTPALSRRPLQWSEPQLYKLQELAIANIAEQPTTGVLANKLRQAPQKIINQIDKRREGLKEAENLKYQLGKYSSFQLIKLGRSGQLARTPAIGLHLYKKEFKLAQLTEDLRRAARNTNNPVEILTNIRMHPMYLVEFRRLREF